MDFAPVIDVLYNDNNKVIGDRAFGNNEEIVSRHGLKVAKGLSDNGVIPVFKHFPGHGSTDVDSHKDLPIINSIKEELLNSSIIPFKKAIEEDAKVIMVGHLSVPSITNSNTPASLSKEIITDFLRNDLGFTGIVITDALDMDAITKYYKEDDICPKAFLAGADILLMPSLFEPCGLTQMEAMAKGSLPIATSTGGLVDTIDDGIDGFRTEAFFAGGERIYGSNLKAQSLKNNLNAYSETLEKALRCYYTMPRTMHIMQKNAMEKDFSWDLSVNNYLYVYSEALMRGCGINTADWK